MCALLTCCCARAARCTAAWARAICWWLVEHYSAMLGNGIATHVAFVSIGLPRLLPAVDGVGLHYLGWLDTTGDSDVPAN
ncbi:MAG: hypothetical protein LC715_00305 [Gammaproteobacteria bacterium]|nr:hypothetical protein [Gammaproteobacteria bacterium]